VDLNGHVGTKVDGYDGVPGGYGFEERNADSERPLQFCHCPFTCGKHVFQEAEE